jgi:hypothetical protein
MRSREIPSPNGGGKGMERGSPREVWAAMLAKSFISLGVLHFASA